MGLNVMTQSKNDLERKFHIELAALADETKILRENCRKLQYEKMQMAEELRNEQMKVATLQAPHKYRRQHRNDYRHDDRQVQNIYHTIH